MATKFPYVTEAATIRSTALWGHGTEKEGHALPESINALFTRRLEILLEERGMKKADLAKFLQVERSTITRYAQGRVPDAQTLDKIAGLFNVATDFLLGRTDDRQGKAAGSGLMTRSDESDELIVVFRGKRQKLSPEYQKVLIDLLDAAHRKMEGEDT